MRLKFIDNTKTGVGRYLPTFVNAYSCLKVGLIDRIEKRRYRKLLTKGDLDAAISRLSEHPNHQRAVLKIMRGDDDLLAWKAKKILLEANVPGAFAAASYDIPVDIRYEAAWIINLGLRQGGIDSSAVPDLIKALKDKPINVRGTAAKALAQAAKEDGKA